MEAICASVPGTSFSNWLRRLQSWTPNVGVAADFDLPLAATAASAAPAVISWRKSRRVVVMFGLLPFPVAARHGRDVTVEALRLPIDGPFLLRAHVGGHQQLGHLEAGLEVFLRLHAVQEMPDE